MIAGLPFALPPALEQMLRRAYEIPARAYHNFDHVSEVLEHYATVPTWDDPRSVALAILFHDAIYVPGRTDNELESARFAQRALAGHPLSVAYDTARVSQLILLTARHGALQGDALDPDAKHFVDCDMAILGAEPERYARYERAIASEYAHVPKALYRAGRARFLSKLLACPRIFLSDTFFARLEQRARANLSAAVADLALAGDANGSP